MKKKYLILIVLTMSLGSCKKFLETAPTDFADPNSYYTTADQLTSAIAGTYGPLGSQGLWGGWTQYMLGFQADEGYNNRSSLVGPHSYNINSTNEFSRATWIALYDGINKANVVIANVDNNKSINATFRAQVRGEALFLRGFYYFQLVQYWGGVPLRTTPTETITSVNLARSSIKEVYDQILSDMKAAEPLVPEISTLGFGGRVSKSAVRGMLARVCLFMAGEPLKDVSKYAESKAWAEKVMNDPVHSLNPSFPDIFKRLAGDQYDIKESIWEVEFSGNRLDEYVETGNQGWINGLVTASGNILTGRSDGYMRCTSKLYNAFEPGDNRLFWSIAHFTYTTPGTVNGQKTLAPVPPNEAAKYDVLYYNGKFRREYETKTPKSGTTTPQNVSMLRYADILMMYAEAENELNGPSGSAVNAVNLVRRRGWNKGVKTITVTNGGTGYTTAPTVTFSAGTGGNTATGTAVISGGKVTGITLNRDANAVTFYQEGEYATPPAITISGGGGTGATATATIYVPADADVPAIHRASKDAFRLFIRDERMREFSYELSRKADLHRWGIFAQTMLDMGNRFKSEGASVNTNNASAFWNYYFDATQPKYAFWPIPSVETALNQAIVQNPGWD